MGAIPKNRLIPPYIIHENKLRCFEIIPNFSFTATAIARMRNYRLNGSFFKLFQIGLAVTQVSTGIAIEDNYKIKIDIFELQNGKKYYSTDVSGKENIIEDIKVIFSV